MSNIFESFLSTPEMRDVFSEQSFVADMLRFEAALAHAQAELKLIPEASAKAIIAACDAGLHDVEAIVAESGRAGSVAIPLVGSLKEAVGRSAPDAVAFTHFGSTSQDVIDTALALASRRALALLETDLSAAFEALLKLAEAHAGTPVLARTLMQPASVTSFGLKCAGWAAPLLRGQQRLKLAADRALALQLGGAVGTLAQLGTSGPAVVEKVAAELGLRAPSVAWHTQRDELVAMGCELGLLAGSLGKIAKDIALMGQFEVAEVAEPSEAGRGGSSTMPHKKNPVACMVAVSAAQRAPQHVAALLACMPQEHERALGNWQAELAEWPGLWAAVQGSASTMAQALSGLEVDSARMLANIEAVRQVLPQDAADEWFAPALAAQAAGLAREQVAALRKVQASLNPASLA